MHSFDHLERPVARITPHPSRIFGGLRRRTRLLSDGLGKSIATFAALLGVVSVAAAQTNNPADETVSLDAFTVTSASDRGYAATHAIGATRTNLAIKDISQVVTVLTQEFLNDVVPGEQFDALKYVSGVSVASNSGDNFTFRGYTLGGAYADGLPDAQNQSNIGAESFMYDRLEVFKGPSALVYGSHSPGGVINRVRKAADLSRASGGTVGAVVGNHGQMRGQFDYNHKLNDSFGYRVVGVWRDEDLVQGVPTQFAFTERYNFNPSFVWKINERAQLKVVAETMSEAHFKNWSEVFALRPFGLNGPTTLSEGLLPQNFTISDSSSRNKNQKYGYFSSLEMELAENWSMRLLSSLFKWDHEVNDWVPNGISADNRTMLRRHRLTMNDDFEIANAIDTVFTFDTGPLKHKVVALAQYNRTHDDEAWVQDSNLFPLDILNPDYFQNATGGVIANPVPGAVFDPAIIDTFVDPNITRLRTYLNHQWSVSGQDQISMADGRLQMVGGIRYDTYSTQTNDRLSGVDGEVGRGNNFTYKFGAIWDVTKELTAFYNYSETFQPNFGAQPDGTLFKPRVGTINEVGLKSSFMDGRLSGTLAAFEIEQTNLLQNDPDPIRASNGWRIQTALNRVRGVELDLAANLMANWELMLSGSMLDIFQDNGLVPRGVPEKTAAFFTRYRFDEESPLKGLTLGGGVNWIGPTPLESGNNYFGQDTAVVDVFGRYVWNNYDFQLNVSNLMDERYLQRGVNRTILFHGPVRLIKFSMRYSF